MRIITAPAIALVLFAGACADLPSGITETPLPQPASFRAELRCTADVAQASVTCESGVPGGTGPSRNLIVGGQNVYVRLASTGAGYNPSDSIFQVDVSVENLMTQAFGTPDGMTDTGLTVFFASGPTPVPAGGNVEVHNEDGQAVFLTSLEPYFTYEGPLYPRAITATKPWQFKMDPEVTRFVFYVYVRGEMPHESSLLLFRQEYQPSGGAFVNGIWGASATEVFAAGDAGTLLRYTGGTWAPDVSPTMQMLWDVWGSSASDVFAVGDSGTIVHWNGTDWQTMDSGLEAGCGCFPPSLYAVWGSGPNDVYAVGDEGVIVHFDGTDWVAEDTMPVYLYAVWGSGPNDVFVAGDEGAIFHYDGTAWTPMVSGLEGTGEYLNMLWGLSPTDVYATASNGVLHYDGVSWSPLPGAETCEHIGIWGSAADDLFVTNVCGVAHYDGDTWTFMDVGGFATDIWGTSPTHVLTNTNGGIFRGSR